MHTRFIIRTSLVVMVIVVGTVGIYFALVKKSTPTVLQPVPSDLYGNDSIQVADSQSVSETLNTPIITPPPSPPLATGTVSENWQTYRNEQFGFDLMFTDVWKGFKVESVVVGPEQDITNIMFWIPSDYNPCAKALDKCRFDGFITPFYIRVSPVSAWEKLTPEEKKLAPFYNFVIAQNVTHIFTLVKNNTSYPEVDFDAFGIPKIVSTFRLLR